MDSKTEFLTTLTTLASIEDYVAREFAGVAGTSTSSSCKRPAESGHLPGAKVGDAPRRENYALRRVE